MKRSAYISPFLPEGLSPSARFGVSGETGDPAIVDGGSWPDDDTPGLGAVEFIDGSWRPLRTPITLLSPVSRAEVESRVEERLASRN
jgi:hypothetical protein